MDKATQRDLSIGIAITWGAIMIASAIIGTWGEMWSFPVGGAAGSLILIEGVAMKKKRSSQKVN